MALHHDKLFQMRASAEWLEKLDRWRGAQSPIPSRAEAIRSLVDASLWQTPTRQGGTGPDR